MDLSARARRIPAMSRSFRSALLVLLVLQFASVARADGPPVLGYADPGASVRSADGTHRYLARPLTRLTVVKAISPTATVSRTIRGSFAIPMVAFDGSLGGLSADGRTLVLTRPRTSFPDRTSVLALLDPERLSVVRVVNLGGDFAFDAISPTGRWIYLIQYSSASSGQYRVRALDARTGRLLPRDIVDPHDRGEQMQGVPLSRVTSPEGRWAYTLYGGAAMPFIHALDTTRRQARCIDVPAFPASVQPYAVRLRLSGHWLAMMSGNRILRALDTRSWRLLAESARVRSATSTSSMPQVGALAAIILLAGAAGLTRRRFRAR
jgi:hypothetical protein